MKHFIGAAFAAALLLAGCQATDLCSGGAPYDGACVCDEDSGRTAVEAYRDRDADGYGGGTLGYWCGGGFAGNSDDCDDNDAGAYPEDRDGDGVTACPGATSDADCDDGDPAIHPGAEEICDGLDNDCDGSATGEEDLDGDGYPLCADDCDDDDPLLTPADADGDGVTSCDDPPDCDDGDAGLTPFDEDGDGASTCDGDCDDGDVTLNIDDLDGDFSTTCDGDCDDDDPAREGLDMDGDGFTTCDGDCDDGDDELNLHDLDNDGFTPCDGDCNDFNDDVDPADLDGDLYSTCDGDCDDGDATAFPEPTLGTGWSRDCAPWFAADLQDTDWYGARVEQPALVDDGSTVGLYYVTEDAGGLAVVGLMTTPDMVDWTEFGGPVLEGTGDPSDWDGQGVSSPSVVYDPADQDNPYKMYFAAEQPAGVTEIGLAVSSDGSTWGRYEDPGAPGETLRAIAVGQPGDLDEVVAGDPHVWIDGDGYHMLYTCSNTFAAGLCLASSTDLGYTWAKWDPEPGEGMDPEPLLIPGGPGEWDGLDVGQPLWLESSGDGALLYAGDSAAGWATGIAHTPFGVGGAVTRIGDLAPVFGPSTQAGRWDDTAAIFGGGMEDGGVVEVFYTGVRQDPGGDIAQIGRAVGEVPDVLLSEPSADPHVMNAGDAVTFSGWVFDEGPLDELLMVISSATDDELLLTAYAEANGDFSLEAPAGTFIDDPSPYVVTVSAYDAGGLAGVTSVTLDVSP